MSGISSFEDIEKEIERVKNDFYKETGPKNTFFKKAQKYDCAKQVATKVQMDILLTRTCTIIHDTYCVHIDYPILKSFACPDNFDIISEFIISTFQHIKDTYGKLEVAFNLDGFTISAAERYKSLIEVFCDKCFQKNTGLSPYLTQFIVYNSPNLIESIRPIVMPFMEENVKERLVVVSRKDSEKYNRQFSNIHLHM